MSAKVENEKCTGCAACKDICPVESITIVDDVAVVDEDTCIDCGQCVDECPTSAITLE